MFWLIAATLLSFGFGQLWKWSQRRSLSAPVVVSTNYLTIAALLMVYFAGQGTLSFSYPVLLVGSATGLSFIVSMLVMTHALERTNVGPVLTSFRLSILVPIVYGIVIWDENATSLQYLGIILALLSLILMTWNRNTDDNTTSQRSLALILAIFGLQGISHCCLRWVHYADLDPQRMHVLAITTLSAGIVGALFVLVRRQMPKAREISMGLGIGLFNLVALGASLTALSLYQGTLFFPLNGSAVVILDNLCAHYLWREPLNRMGLLGAGLGIVSILLIFQYQ